ncbi:hypothetical protein [Flavobacterium sp.]|jgi:hypothetical protein|uniref:hypothetical protein n=1 Tax=Flavobacterium sp. TaxID=239 RepID=UPI0037C19307
MTPEQQDIMQQLAQMGDVVYVKEDGSRIILNEEGKIPLKTNADAVFYFLERMDSNMLNLILDKNLPYQDYEKKMFVKKLSYAFDEFFTRGNTHLNRFEGKCTSNICTNVNCQGFSFVGNSSKDYMDLILEIKNNKVTDIYECSKFVNSETDLIKNEKICIDTLEEPF